MMLRPGWDEVNGWGPQGLSVWERPASYQLVGEVMAHQGDDG
jgi:hypothetical protein